MRMSRAPMKTSRERTFQKHFVVLQLEHSAIPDELAFPAAQAKQVLSEVADGVEL